MLPLGLPWNARRWAGPLPPAWAFLPDCGHSAYCLCWRNAPIAPTPTASHRAIADRLFLAGARGFITPRQHAVLIAVCEGGNLNCVIERTGIDRSTTSELVRRMAPLESARPCGGLGRVPKTFERHYLRTGRAKARKPQLQRCASHDAGADQQAVVRQLVVRNS